MITPAGSIPPHRHAELQWPTQPLARPIFERGALSPGVILLFSRDRAFDNLVAQALLGRSAIVLITRNVGDALQIVCGRGRELQLAILDLDEECRGMALLSAMHTCYEELPVLIAASIDEERLRTLAYANGARACLNKPVQLATLADTIAALSGSHESVPYSTSTMTSPLRSPGRRAPTL